MVRGWLLYIAPGWGSSSCCFPELVLCIQEKQWGNWGGRERARLGGTICGQVQENLRAQLQSPRSAGTSSWWGWLCCPKKSLWPSLVAICLGARQPLAWQTGFRKAHLGQDISFWASSDRSSGLWFVLQPLLAGEGGCWQQY